MNVDQKRELEKLGWKIGDAADFLEMTNEEREELNKNIASILKLKQEKESDKSS